jgi:serine/threonine protein phosphatase PrpC
MLETMFLNSAAFSQAGAERDQNEDAVYEETGSPADELAWPSAPNGLYIICDGLGGHQAGEVASQLAVQTVAARLAPILSDQGFGDEAIDQTQPLLRQRTLEAVLAANVLVWQEAKARSAEKGGSLMGTTITLALVSGNVAYIAHVGHSRAYLWHTGRVRQLTRDHTLAAKLAERGLINDYEIVTHPHSNVLSRAIGQHQVVSVDLFQYHLKPSDRLLLCSNGLWKAFPDADELGEWIGMSAAPAEICGCLVDEAQSRDGSDDTSAVIVVVGQDADSRDQFEQVDEIPVPEAVALPV